MFGFFLLQTLYLQFVLGYSALSAGIAALPLSLAFVIIASRTASLVARFGSGAVMGIGFAIMAGGLALLTSASTSTTYPVLALAFVLLGIGMALISAPATGNIMMSTPLDKAGVGSAVNDTTRELGGALGIAIAGSLIATIYGATLDLTSLGQNSSEAIHLVAEAMKLAFADRAFHMGDPDFHRVPTQWLMSKAYGLELAERLKPRPFWRRPPWRWGRSRVLRVERPGIPPPDDAGTTHISVLDDKGNAVALTQTINTLFGSGVTAPGTGIVLNNEMDDFAAAADAPNAYGLVGHSANAVAPGKRPLSSMTPTIVLRDGRPWLVAGSPMGPLIITTVLQTLLNLVDFDLGIQAAVVAPRFHHQWQPDRLLLEPGHPRDVALRLQAWGHPVQRSTFRFGASASILRDPESGLLWGGADPRRDSRALGY